MVDHKHNLINALKILKDNSKVEGGIFQTRAYDKVIKNLEKITVSITSYKQIENIEGAGKNIKLKFREIIDKGHLDISVDNIKMQLLQIYGIGPVKAQILVDDYKIKFKAGFNSSTSLILNILWFSPANLELCYGDVKEILS